MTFDPFKKYEFKFDEQGWFDNCLVPKSIAVCPCCDSGLILDCDEWSLDEEINIYWPDDVKPNCLRDRQEIRPICFIENKNHIANRMPYVYWLPIEDKCQTWLNRMLRIYYKIDPMPKRWLEKNGQGVLFSKVKVC